MPRERARRAQLRGRLVERLAEEGYEVTGPISTSPPQPRAQGAARGPPARVDVAIKALPLTPGLSTKKVDRFQAEARAPRTDRRTRTSSAVLDVQERPELLYIVMDLIDGETLLERIERLGKLPARDALAVGLVDRAGARGGRSAGDRPPEREARERPLREDGTPKLVDFGLAKDLRPRDRALTGDRGDARHDPLHAPRAGEGRAQPPTRGPTSTRSRRRSSTPSRASSLPLPLRARPPEERDHRPAPRVRPDPRRHAAAWRERAPRRCLKHAPAERPQPDELAAELERIAIQVGDTVPELPGRASDSQIFRALTPTFGSSTKAFAGRPPQGATRAGSFAQGELHELAQRMAAAGETGVLEVRTRGSDVGVLSIRDGKVVLARTSSGGRGESAALEVLGVREGEYAFQLGLAADVKAEHELALAPLVLEAARRRLGFKK